jgi:hypothetical protein
MAGLSTKTVVCSKGAYRILFVDDYAFLHTCHYSFRKGTHSGKKLFPFVHEKLRMVRLGIESPKFYSTQAHSNFSNPKRPSLFQKNLLLAQSPNFIQTKV